VDKCVGKLGINRRIFYLHLLFPYLPLFHQARDKRQAGNSQVNQKGTWKAMQPSGGKAGKGKF